MKRTAPPPPASGRATPSLRLAAAANLPDGAGQDGCRPPLWATATTISGAIVAPGRIEVERNLQVVQHPDGGVISEIHVEDGTLVEAGALLFSLDRQDLGAELDLVDGEYFELLARIARLTAERDGAAGLTFDPELLARAATSREAADMRDGQSRLFHARRDSVRREAEQLGKRRAQLADQIRGLDAQLRSSRAQKDLNARELANQTTLLEKQLTQSSVVLRLKREAEQLDGSIGELIAERAQTEGRITETDLELLKLQTQRREEAITQLRDIAHQVRQTRDSRRHLLERIERLKVRAPVSGVVHDLKVNTPRSVIGPGDPLLFLVPQDRPLVIQAKVATTDIDEVYPGQPVTLRLSALDRRATPELSGHVVRTSPDSFEDDRTGQSYFAVELRVDRGQIGHLPVGLDLVPGMPVDAFIRTRDRTPLDYLIKPFADYFVRALRET